MGKFRRYTLVLFAACAIAATATAFYLTIYRNYPCANADAQCEKNLQAIRYCILQYSEEHHDQLPDTIDHALEGTDRSVFHHCRQNEPFSYSFVNWSWKYKAAGTKTLQLPLAFDSSPDLHKAKGIYILLSDTTVMWDADGKWLQTFLAAHPETRVQAP